MLKVRDFLELWAPEWSKDIFRSTVWKNRRETLWVLVSWTLENMSEVLCTTHGNCRATLRGDGQIKCLIAWRSWRNTQLLRPDLVFSKRRLRDEIELSHTLHICEDHTLQQTNWSHHAERVTNKLCKKNSVPNTPHSLPQERKYPSEIRKVVECISQAAGTNHFPVPVTHTGLQSGLEPEPALEQSMGPGYGFLQWLVLSLNSSKWSQINRQC